MRNSITTCDPVPPHVGKVSPRGIRVGSDILYLFHVPSEVGLSNRLSPAMTTPNRPRAGTITINYLRLIANGDLTSPKAIAATLTNAFGAGDYSICLKSLRSTGIDPQAFIDGLEKVCSDILLSQTTLTNRSILGD